MLVSVEVSVEGDSSISGGMGRVVTIWVTDLEKNFSSRYMKVSAFVRQIHSAMLGLRDGKIEATFVVQDGKQM